MAKREEITRLLAVNALFEPDRIVHNFSNMGTMFHTTPMPLAAHQAEPLPTAPRPATLPPGLEDWIAARGVTSLVALHRGEVVYEGYFRGTGRDDLRVSWSVAKSFLAALFGIFVENGAIASLDDPVTKYAPALSGSAYDGASIRNVLNMASGVAFNEDYADFWSDINRMGRVIALGGSLDDFAASLTERRAEPGAAFHYVSIDTHVLGMVLRGATGRSVPELMAEHIFAPLGLEADPYFLADGTGAAFVLGGLNMTARDYARFGQLILQGGRWGEVQVVPENWVMEMTAESAPGERPRYGYQWWLPNDGRPGEVFAQGLYGQYIWIDPRNDAVVAMTSADLGFLDPGVQQDSIEKLRMIGETLR
ncbi:serine hydrolase domain-containing protein [Sinisalibacter lacisalsi]|nr:serine hydrolase [Sinisalibacter lacisalsi]